MEGDQQLQKCDPVTILNSSKLQLKASDTVLDIGPFKVTCSDLWSTLQPAILSTPVAKQIEEEVPGFVPGWLTDTVSGNSTYTVIKKNTYAMFLRTATR